ncbi:MAG: cytochrome c-type biogenesis protein [Pseudomonadales bacterium]|jgi:cytochrome c-type biogenesis protein CcmH
MRTILRLFLLIAVSLTSQSFAAIDTYEFADEQTRERFYRLNHELRCPKCQNQSLADSNSPISMDLRREVYRLLEEGKNDREIKDYLVDRYGEYILYRPELSPHTLMLWLAPLILLLIGAVALIVLIKRRRLTLAQSSALDTEEQARLDRLLKDSHTATDKDLKARD